VERVRSWLPLLGWLGSLAAGIVLFTALGGGALEAPPLGQPSAWGDWAAARDPFVAVVAVLRLVVLALAWYLVAVTTVGLVARLTRAARLVRVADALSVPLVRQLLQGALGLTLAAGVVASSSGAVPATTGRADGAAVVTATAIASTGDRGPGDAGVSMVALDAADADGARMVALDDTDAPDPDGGARMVALDDRATARMVGLGPPGAGAADAEPDRAAPDAGEHEVVAGEHLWSIAAAHLAAHLDRAPTEAEITPHWRRLVEENRDRLANPDDPDLLFPGQRLVLPDLPGGSDA
jgi:resuscitation-promoting factor RpfA